MPSDREKSITVAKGEDTRNLLDHIAWTDVIEPELEKRKALYGKLLVAAVLGSKITIPGSSGPTDLTPEQLAGRIDGINFIQTLLKRILRDGASAFSTLNDLSS
jgi:hypothetical protein